MAGRIVIQIMENTGNYDFLECFLDLADIYRLKDRAEEANLLTKRADALMAKANTL